LRLPDAANHVQATGLRKIMHRQWALVSEIKKSSALTICSTDKYGIFDL